MIKNFKKPIILNLKKFKDYKDFIHLKKKGAKIIDHFNGLWKEKNKNFKKLNINENINIKNGRWVYYPWHNSLIHILDRKTFYNLRISRNRGLISDEEQDTIKNFTVGIAGLNIGNPVAMSLTLQGFLKFKLADNDVLELSNLNRLASGFRLIDLYKNKTFLTAQQIYDIDPFAKIYIFPNGLTENNLNKFLLKPKINLLIEEMDNLYLKIKVRELAKKFKIPVIMATGNESNVILDIERYDISNRLKILNGYLVDAIKNRIINFTNTKETPEQKFLLARDFIGAKFLTNRMKNSFKLLSQGKLTGIPQLSEVSFQRAAILTLVTRKIAVGEKVPSGRYYFEINNLNKFKLKFN